MLVDILMAFVIALLLQMFSLMGKNFKQIAIFVSCITIISVYFISGCKIDFPGKIDLAVWLSFVIVFNELLTRVTAALVNTSKQKF